MKHSTQSKAGRRIGLMQHLISRGGQRSRLTLVLAGVLSAALLAAWGASSAAASGGATGTAASAKPAKLTASSAGGTLTQWNWETEADDPGGHALMPMAIKLFEKAYPKWKVTNREMTLEEQTDSLPLALDSSGGPDVTETNEGFGSMGRLVADNELVNLAAYSKLYGWNSEVGPLPLQYNAFSSDGKAFR